MASWRPPGSILEASGLPFGGSGPHFRRLWTSYLEPRTPRTPKNVQKQKLHHKVARPPKGGWAAVIPPGGFQSAAHRRCAGRAELNSHRPQPKLQTYHKWPSSRWQAQVLCQALGPLSFSLPRSLGTTADPAPRSGILWLCGFFFRFFALPICNPNFASRKHRKKCENRSFGYPKTLPKLRQNRAFFENVDF